MQPPLSPFLATVPGAMVAAPGANPPAGAAADSDEVGGGASILASKNIPFSVIYPHLQTLTPRGTEIAAGIKTTTGKSYAGSETAKQKLPAFQPIKINEINDVIIWGVVTSVVHKV